MKNNSIFNNLFFKIFIIFIVIFAFAIAVKVLMIKPEETKNSIENKNNETIITQDEKKFKEEYESLNDKEIEEKEGYIAPSISITEDNNIVYLTEDNIIQTLKEEKGIIYFGFDWCPWCRRMIGPMIEASKTAGVKQIYYFDFYDIRQAYIDDENSDKGKIYKELIDIIGDKLKNNIEGKDIKRLGAPHVFVFNKGKIIGNHEGVLDEYTDYKIPLTEEQNKELQDIFVNLFKKDIQICSVEMKC